METQPPTVTAIPQPDSRTPPVWLIEKLRKGDAFMDPDEPGAICVHVCRNCQCALPDCLCEDPFSVDSVLIWRPGEGPGRGLNERLGKYLATKKRTHASERAAGGDAFVAVDSEVMRSRMTLWSTPDPVVATPIAPTVAKPPGSVTSSKSVTLADRAAIVLALAPGATVIPVPAKSKATNVGTKRRSRDAEQISKWTAQNPSQNCAAVASYDEDGIWFIDDDKGTLIETVKDETGHDISIYFRVKTADGNHFYFLHDETSRVVRYGKNENSGVIDTPTYKGEARCNEQYVMSPLSVHPSGHIYTIVNDVPLVPAPEWLLLWLKEKYVLSESIKKTNKKSKTTATQTAPTDTTPHGVISTPKGIVIYPNAPDPGFKKLFEVVGWNPLIERLNQDEDGRLHVGDGFVAGAVFACPMPAHKHKDYTPCFGIQKSNPMLVTCLGNCGFSGDLVKACHEFDGHDETMFETAREICEEEGLKYEGFFPPREVPNETGLVSNYVEAASTPAAATLLTSLLVFEDPEKVLLANGAGYDAVTADAAVRSLDTLQSCERVVLFGKSDKWETIQKSVPHYIQVCLPKDGLIDEKFLWRTLEMDAVRLVSKSKPQPRWVLVTPNIQPEPVDTPLIMPDSAMASTRLGDIYDKILKPAGFPLGVALPALVTAASVLVPPLDLKADGERGFIIPGDDAMVNLYTALIGKIHGGKSQCAEWACKSLGIYQPAKSPFYLEGKFGSTEQMLTYLKKRLPLMQKNFLINPDEWSFLFTKAGISNSSFTSFMTTSYYRRTQMITIGNRVGEVHLDHALSYIGGIVADDFDSVFDAATLGGTYDRFLFGWAEGWMWSYRPYPFLCSLTAEMGKGVTRDGSVFEVVASWNKSMPELGRIIEICTRAAVIYACMDGRPTIYGSDLEKLYGLAQNQLAVRGMFNPNAGVTPDAKFANAVINWLTAHTKGEWVNIAAVKKGVHSYEMKLGPNVAERALAAMARSNRIAVWLHKPDREGKDNPLPLDWKGQRPRIGLIRLPS